MEFALNFMRYVSKAYIFLSELVSNLNYLTYSFFFRFHNMLSSYCGTEVFGKY